jgi:hypothetical protein
VSANREIAHAANVAGELGTVGWVARPLRQCAMDRNGCQALRRAREQGCPERPPGQRIFWHRIKLGAASAQRRADSLRDHAPPRFPRSRSGRYPELADLGRELMRTGELTVDRVPAQGERFVSRRLFDDGIVFVARTEHPRARRKLDSDALRAESFIRHWPRSRLAGLAETHRMP